MTDSTPTLRKTRFVCISDTHNASPKGAFQLPKGDVLIHAGDLTNQGTYSELEKTIRWIEESDFEAKIIIAGNHDITLDTDFYTQHGAYFHNQNPQDPARCQELLEASPSILWLKHEYAVVDLASPTGPRTTFKIFGSPLSPTSGKWAFGYEPEQAPRIWGAIPLDADIVLTHGPPKYHCDERKDQRSVGCEDLRRALWRVRPRLALCGHVHEGRGVERIKWDLSASNSQYKESGVERWEDPGLNNKKLSLVDLTAKGGNPLRNDGSVGDVLDQIKTPVTFHEVEDGLKANCSHVQTAAPGSVHISTQGQGGIPPSPRCDVPALSGRLDRKETCHVNAAIMASSWPHNSGGGKKSNKPIVVDIDLPVWDT